MLPMLQHDVSLFARDFEQRDQRRGRVETTYLELPSSEAQTPFVSLDLATYVVRSEGGTLSAREVAAPVMRPPVKLEQADSDAITRTSERRIALLDRQAQERHAGRTIPIEDSARLDILTERLRQLAPRVTSRDVSQLESMIDTLERTASDLAGIKAEFGLK